MRALPPTGRWSDTVTRGRVFSYIVARDGGYSPNPFHGVCTLACCKPQVRRSAERGDLVLGLSGRADGNRLVYGMVVADKMSFADYWRDTRFLVKRPDMTAPDRCSRSGDNHYEPLPVGTYRQHHSRHSRDDGSEDPKAKRRDLGSDQDNPVLIGGAFCYFGAQAEKLPPHLGFLIGGRGHRCHFTPEQVEMAWDWFESLPTGIHGRPSLWPEDDASWRQDGNAAPAPAAMAPRKDRSRGRCS
jgi:hypothetical protein